MTATRADQLSLQALRAKQTHKKRSSKNLNERPRAPILIRKYLSFLLVLVFAELSRGQHQPVARQAPRHVAPQSRKPRLIGALIQF
jgi:hypothetical protein